MDPSATLKLNGMIFSVCFFSKMFSLRGHFFFEKCIMFCLVFCFRCHLVIARCAVRRMLTTKWPRRLGLEITRMCETRRAAVSRLSIVCSLMHFVQNFGHAGIQNITRPSLSEIDLEYLTPKNWLKVWRRRRLPGNPSDQFHDELPFEQSFDRIS